MGKKKVVGLLITYTSECRGKKGRESRGEKSCLDPPTCRKDFHQESKKTGKEKTMGGGEFGLKPLVSYQRSDKKGRSSEEDHTFPYDLRIASASTHW